VTVEEGCTVNVVASERPVGAAPALVAVPACDGGRIPDGDARLTVLVASDEPGIVRVTAAGAFAPIEAAPFAVSAPLDVPAGATTVNLASAGTGAAYAERPAELAAGTATLLTFVGGGDRAFRVFGTFDGAQPAVPPRGVEINTGPTAPAAPGVPGPAGGVGWVPGLLSGAAGVALGGWWQTCRARLLGARWHGPDSTDERFRRLAYRLAAGALVVAAVAQLAACSTGTGADGGGAPTDGGTAAPGGAAAPTGAPPAVASGTSGATAPTGDPIVTAAPPTADPPAQVRIPALGVDAAVRALPTDRVDDLVADLAPTDVGWLDGTASPGTVGTAVLVGHAGTAGSFRALAYAPAGAGVLVTDAGGRERRFVIRSLAVYPKGALPDDLWAPVRTPTVVLVSCTGPRRADGLHRDNVVARAEAETTTEAAAAAGTGASDSTG
jgi:hypothetical protein